MSPRPATAAAGTAFAPINPEYEARVRASFGRQGAMHLIGARLSVLRPGYCAIELPFREDLTQQHGYVHAGIVGAIVDSAGGYAGFTLFPADASVLTVDTSSISSRRRQVSASSRKRRSSSPGGRSPSPAARFTRKRTANARFARSCSRP